VQGEYVEVGGDLHDGGQPVLGWQFVELPPSVSPSHRFRHVVGRGRAGSDVLTHFVETLTVVVENLVDSIAGAGGDGAVRRQQCGVGRSRTSSRERR